MAHPKGGYKLDGKRVPGTTTVIGRFKDSGALMWWAFEQGKSAERGEINNLYDKRDQAADAGTLAHDMFEAHILGSSADEVVALLNEVPEETAELARKGFANALEWLEQTRIEIIDTEMQLISREYRYGGTPDAIGRDPKGRVMLLDWKTSNGVYADYLIQLAAYGHLLEECLGLTVEGYYLCRFSKEHGDFAQYFFSDLSDGWEQFKLFLQAYELDKKLKKRTG